MSWITFATEGGGLLAVQVQHIAAIYDEQDTVKLATTAGGVHLLKDMTVQRAAALVATAESADIDGTE